MCACTCACARVQRAQRLCENKALALDVCAALSVPEQVQVQVQMPNRSFGDQMAETAQGSPNALMCFVLVCRPFCTRSLSLMNAAPFQGLSECSLPMPSRLSPESRKVEAATRIAKVRSRGGHLFLHLFFSLRIGVWGGRGGGGGEPISNWSNDAARIG